MNGDGKSSIAIFRDMGQNYRTIKSGRKKRRKKANSKVKQLRN